jgi:predicted enzyme related to lactoylglutathione lyase
MNGLCYWEIPSMNVAKSSAFYAKLFGWKMTPSGEDYMMFSAKDGLDGGIYHMKETPGKGVLVYIKVKDMSAMLRKVVKLGGKVLKPKTEIGEGWGYWAGFRDPGGCSSVALWSKA